MNFYEKKLQTVAISIKTEIEDLQSKILNMNTDSNFETAMKLSELYREISNRMTVLNIMNSLDISESEELEFNNKMYELLKDSESDSGSVLAYLCNRLSLNETIDNYVEKQLKEIITHG